MSKTNTNAQPAFDPAAAFPTFSMPGFDVDALTANQRRNVEALTEANKLVTDGLQAFATRQAELLKSAVDTYSNALSDMMSGSDPQAGAAKQAELVKTGFETSSANLRELSEIATQAQTKSLDVINKRVAESLNEFQEIAAKV